MKTRAARWVARIAGVLLGAAAFVGVNVRLGRAIVPTLESVNVIKLPPPAPPEPPKPPYQATCSPCHQPNGEGVPFAFPPLAGSPWLTGDPETPIRIVLLGMSGPVDVKGTSFNLVMPPPPGLDDAKIAEAISYARTNFGNAAGPVSAEQVKKVRESLGARATPWTSAELTALRTGAAADGAAASTGTAVPNTAAASTRKKARAKAGRP